MAKPQAGNASAWRYEAQRTQRGDTICANYLRSVKFKL